MAGLGSFTQGLMTGANFVQGLEDRKLRRERWQKQDERLDSQLDMQRERLDMDRQNAELSRAVQQFNLDQLKDTKQINEKIRQGRALMLYLKGNKEPYQGIEDDIMDYLSPLANVGTPEGSTKRFVDAKFIDQETIVPIVEVTRKDGSKYREAVTQNRSDDPNDKVAGIKVKDIWMDVDNVLKMLEYRNAQLGDTSAYDARIAAQMKTLEHERQMALNSQQSRLRQKENLQQHGLKMREQEASAWDARKLDAQQSRLRQQEDLQQHGLKMREQEASAWDARKLEEMKQESDVGPVGQKYRDYVNMGYGHEDAQFLSSIVETTSETGETQYGVPLPGGGMQTRPSGMRLPDEATGPIMATENEVEAAIHKFPEITLPKLAAAFAAQGRQINVQQAQQIMEGVKSGERSALVRDAQKDEKREQVKQEQKSKKSRAFKAVKYVSMLENSKPYNQAKLQAQAGDPKLARAIIKRLVDLDSEGLLKGANRKKAIAAVKDLRQSMKNAKAWNRLPLQTPAAEE